MVVGDKSIAALLVIETLVGRLAVNARHLDSALSSEVDAMVSKDFTLLVLRQNSPLHVDSFCSQRRNPAGTLILGILGSLFM